MVIDKSIIQIALIVIVLYFLYSWSRENRLELWFPLGFTYLFVYLMLQEDRQPNKVKACILGLVVGVYLLISKYWGVY
ncbi:MAG: hypothetical protein K0S34_2636 [Bacillales bacterium]|nr:hypothetical protein [Bacillales bacterium]